MIPEEGKREDFETRLKRVEEKLQKIISALREMVERKETEAEEEKRE